MGNFVCMGKWLFKNMLGAEMGSRMGGGGEGEKNQMYKRGREGKEVRMGSILPQPLKRIQKDPFWKYVFGGHFIPIRKRGRGGGLAPLFSPS